MHASNIYLSSLLLHSYTLVQYNLFIPDFYFYYIFPGTDSFHAVNKLMSLSDPTKTRRHQPKHSVSSLHSVNSPSNSPPNARRGDLAPPGGSSATLKKAGNSNTLGKGGASSSSSGHERSSSSDMGKVKVSLSKESSSVTSLPALRKAGHSTSKCSWSYSILKNNWVAYKNQF